MTKPVVGYLVPEFPTQTHIFFWRELRAIEEAGLPLAILSTRRPTASCPHAFADEAVARTDYLMPPRPAELAAILPSLPRLVLLARRAAADKGQGGSPRTIARLTALAVIGAVLARRAGRRGLRHVHGHSCADVGYVLAFSRLLGGPRYSLTLHGDLDVYGDGHAFKFRHAEAVTCVTHALIDQVRERVGDVGTPLSMIRMGADLDKFTGWQDRVWSAGGTLRLLTVARLDPFKGHRFALEAIARLVQAGLDIRYDIVGQGHMRDEIERDIADLGLVGRVTLHGTRSADQVVDHLLAADAFVLPSHGLGEAAPVSVMEAMGAGLPVICSLIGGTGEMIDDGRTGFLTPQKDVAALADRMAALARDTDLRRTIGAAARAHAEAHFSTRGEAAKLMAVIAP
ncbi:glycosyltransferase involved in cell wall biosynthesis [Sphingomonas jejuensis]|uniref:Glycosyltransferase involved in cell wall biosynthesis n=1 Tax=Sphingomonas jejuensis TaxID=904715 RepID=A0ABX0XLS7_9SPHN|nr:exopolysaccharide biosynthesis GT4 family glycosyltransferase EpsE [Sphingomonas jejuensis]NJC33721.1 glycosyltransferase involved in cell wall biosynthesis [Sphingomonas jejuensis]